MSADYLAAVRAQYEEYPYPSVNPEDERKRLFMPLTEGFPYIGHFCFGGMKDPRRCRYLVAGGGTGHAVIAIAEQLRGHEGEVVYLDLSQKAMEIAKERARIRGLEDRIEWRHGSLLSVAKLGLGKFDYINCSGVLHHLADPQQGLDALASVLKPDGALGLMLYATYGRQAVYQLQDALKLINDGIDDPQQKVENTKKVLSALPQSSWLAASPKVIVDELKRGDAAIYDLLLHSQDRAYTVPQIYDFLAASGLKLIEFMAAAPFDIKQYDPAHYIKDGEMLERIRRLPLEQQYALAELLNGKICRHSFYAAPALPAGPSLENPEMVPFFSDAFMAGIYQQFRQRVEQSGDMVGIDIKGMQAVFPSTPHLKQIAAHLDGQRSLGEIHRAMQKAGCALDYTRFIAEFSGTYHALSAYRWMLLRHKSIPPYPPRNELHERLNLQRERAHA